MPGIPGYQPGPRPLSVRSRGRQGRAWTTALDRPSASRPRLTLGKLKFGFNTDAGHEPASRSCRSVATRTSASRPSRSAATSSVFRTSARPVEYDDRPQRAGARTTRTRTTSCALFAAASGNNDERVQQPRLRRSARPGRRRAGSRPSRSRSTTRLSRSWSTTRRPLAPLRPSATTRSSPYVEGVDRHRSGLARHRRPVLRDHPDR